MLATTRELCDALRIHPNTAHRMVRDGRIPPEYVTDIGGRYRFNLEAIEAHLLGKAERPEEGPSQD